MRTEAQKEYHRSYMRAWRKDNPLTSEQRFKDNARSYTHVYVKRGKIAKKACNICGELDVQAHHLDYNNPLNILWLCPLHHKLIHLSTKDSVCELDKALERSINMLKEANLCV